MSFAAVNHDCHLKVETNKMAQNPPITTQEGDIGVCGIAVLDNFS